MATIDLSKMTLPEIMAHVSEVPNDDRPNAMVQIAKFRPDFKAVLQLVFVKEIEIDLPSGTPPYKKLDMPQNWGYNRLPRELKKMHYFIKGSGNNIKAIKKEAMFIEMLESLSPEEAKLLLQIKDKKLEYKGITKRYVKKAFPEFFPGDTEE